MCSCVDLILKQERTSSFYLYNYFFKIEARTKNDSAVLFKFYFKTDTPHFRAC